MAFMTILSEAVAGDLTNWIARFLLILHNAIGSSFGWTVVVFSIILRLIMSPLDVWQKFSMRKQQAKMAALQPKLAKIQKQYANNPDKLKEETYKLQQKAGMNMFSSCLPMIISMIIFFVVFAGFRDLVVYINEEKIAELSNLYAQLIADPANTPEMINKQLAEAYKPETWLWIKNVFMSDIGTTVVPTYQQYIGSNIGANLPNGMVVTYETLVQPAMDLYNKTGTWDFMKWNGYFVLPILAIATSFLSTWLMQKLNPQQASVTGDPEQDKMQKSTMKVMNYIMPLMLGIFAIMYSAAFAIYYVMSNILMTLSQLLFTVIMNAVDKNKAKKAA